MGVCVLHIHTHTKKHINVFVFDFYLSSQMKLAFELMVMLLPSTQSKRHQPTNAI